MCLLLLVAVAVVLEPMIAKLGPAEAAAAAVIESFLHNP
jgi:hypothetical protein